MLRSLAGGTLYGETWGGGPPAVLALHAPGLLPLLAPAMVAAQSGLRAVASRTTQAGADPLTAVANRATLLARMRHRMSRPGGAKDPVTLLLVDVDSFKQVNDAHGHLAGDRVLVEVSADIGAGLPSFTAV